MDTTIREDGILEFKALVMSKGVFAQVPAYQPKGVMPEVCGWVNYEGEWYIAITGGRLVKMRRVDLWDAFALGVRAEHEGEYINYAHLNVKLDKWRDELPQIFLR